MDKALTLTEAKAQIERRNSTIERFRRESERAAQRLTGIGAGLAGAAGAGFIHGKQWKVPMTDLPLAPAIGGAFVLAGLFDLFGDASDAALTFGGSMGGYTLGRLVEDGTKNGASSSGTTRVSGDAYYRR